jgi:hypothetical protein
METDTPPARKKSDCCALRRGNIRNNHIYVKGHYDFFPPDCFGGARRSSRSGMIDIQLAGLRETVTTDIAGHATTGKPRGFFRDRRWVRRFFQQHDVKPGTVLALESHA